MEGGEGLEPCASLGSWCILGQTHATQHVAVTGEQAKFCIYLMAQLAGFHLHSFVPKTMMVVPNDENIWKGRTALVVVFVSAAVAAHLLRPQEVAEQSSRW